MKYYYEQSNITLIGACNERSKVPRVVSTTKGNIHYTCLFEEYWSFESVDETNSPIINEFIKSYEPRKFVQALE